MNSVAIAVDEMPGDCQAIQEAGVDDQQGDEQIMPIDSLPFTSHFGSRDTNIDTNIDVENVVQVPQSQVHEFVMQAPAIAPQEAQRQVPVPLIQTVEEIVGVPQAETVERIQDVPPVQFQEIVSQVPRVSFHVGVKPRIDPMLVGSIDRLAKCYDIEFFRRHKAGEIFLLKSRWRRGFAEVE